MTDDTFELEVRVKNDREVEASTTGGSEARGDVTWDQLREQMVEILEDWLRRQGKIRSKELRFLGSILYRAIFGSEIDRLFWAELGRAKSATSRLRLELVFDENAAHLSRLPWEYLHRPLGENLLEGYFLARHTDLILSHFIPSEDKRGNLEPPEEDRLKILLVVCQTEDLLEKGQGVAVSQYKGIVQTIRSFKKKRPIEIIEFKDDERATLDNLARFVERHEPHVVHYIGHGKYDSRDEEGSIALLAEEGDRARWWKDSNFGACFDRHKPQLLFLHLCHPSQTGDNYIDASFAGLAAHLVRRSIQAVVAMRYPIKPDLAERFTNKFYEELMKGESVGTAVQEGRRWMSLEDDSRLGSPVLYMHTRDGPILRTPEPLSHQVKVTAPKLEEAKDALPSFSVDQLAYLARDEAARHGSLESEKVEQEIKWLMSESRGRDMDDIKQLISDKISADPTSATVGIWIGWLRALKPPEPRVLT